MFVTRFAVVETVAFAEETNRVATDKLAPVAVNAVTAPTNLIVVDNAVTDVA